MGTRRSRHNKVRKPRYKNRQRGLGRLLEAHPEDAEWRAFFDFVSRHMPGGPACPDCGSQDHYVIKTRKRFKCAACHRQYSATAGTAFESHKISFQKMNEIDAMKPCSVTDLMNRTGLTYRGAWALRNRLGQHKTQWAQPILHTPAPRPSLSAYPFIRRANGENADIIEVNNIVPKGFNDAMRADICQEILLALLEGRVTMDDLRRNKDRMRFFVRKFMRDNHEASGHAKSLVTEDDQRLDEMMAARDYRQEQAATQSSWVNALQRRYHAPTQLSEAHIRSVERHQERLHSAGLYLSLSEAEDDLEPQCDMWA